MAANLLPQALNGDAPPGGTCSTSGGWFVFLDRYSLTKNARLGTPVARKDRQHFGAFAVRAVVALHPTLQAQVCVERLTLHDDQDPR